MAVKGVRHIIQGRLKNAFHDVSGSWKRRARNEAEAGAGAFEWTHRVTRTRDIFEGCERR